MSELFKSDPGAAQPLQLPPAGSRSIASVPRDWQDCGADGFRIKPLVEDPGSGIRTWLMKVEPGAFAELHAHEEIEQIYVVEGSFYDQEKSYRAGDFIVRAPGAMHTAGSDSGAIVLLFYSPAA